MPLANAIAALRHVFSYFELPEHLVSDNGTQFTSAEFQTFLRDNEIQRTLTAPGHPATNGLAERYVGEFKDKLSKIGDAGKSNQTKLDQFLLTYRGTYLIGKSPSELLMNRQPRIKLNALRAENTKQKDKVFQDNLDNRPKFKQDQPLFVRSFGKGAKWVPGRIMRTVSPRNYDVQVCDTLWKRHEEQMRPRRIPTEQCFMLMREPQVLEPRDISTSVRDDMPITTSPPSVNQGDRGKQIHSCG